MNDSGWNMYVFRDGRRTVRGTYLKAELQHRLRDLCAPPGEDQLLAALIAAGELECALADAGAPNASASSITDAVADFLMRGARIDTDALAKMLCEIEAPERLSTSVAEGFAYYALHPFRFRAPVHRLQTNLPVRILGVRSIGTSLSAVVRALLAEGNSDVERITVRPHSHPYDRKVDLSEAEREWISQARNAMFVIVDEGPGLSGSSFLSVAEAVEACGVPACQIAMLGSRYPDIRQLRAPNVTTRWPRFRFLAADPAPLLPGDAHLDLTGGLWRQFFWTDFDRQPAAWAQLEPAKYMRGDRKAFYKFHGFGHFGQRIAERAQLAADAGFAPAWIRMERGFGTYEVVNGHLLSPEGLSPELIDRAAEYCAFRATAMQVPETGPSELESMAEWNWQCEFGCELKGLHLAVERLVVADGRMLPHEWIRTADHRVLKLDGSTHGDDHFFPGPCDIAWDLAGMIVEWQMDESQKMRLLELYREKSGDDPRRRIDDYILAYSIFRMGWSKMAAQASAGSFDEKLLLRDYARYRSQVVQFHAGRQSERVAERPATSGLQPAIAV
jgi:hypothetical protein